MISLDDDVATLISQEMRRSGASFKEVVNGYIRKGLAASKPGGLSSPFVVRPRAMGLPPGLGYDNVEELIETIEGPAHR